MIQLGEQATTDVACTQVSKGDVWNGFEWVSPERYEQQRATTMPDLPPLQPTADDARRVAEADLRQAWYPATPEVLSQPMPFGNHIQRARTMEDNITDILLMLEATEDGGLRGGLLETPSRVAKAYETWFGGYAKDPAKLLKVFEDGAEETDEMVVVRGIPVYSHCEHHLAPIFGTATVAYIPGEEKRIVGLSKMSRLVDMYARRLQVQERMTNQVATALMEHLAPLGCGVVINARHMCMESRGVQHQSDTTTSALRGNFKTDPTVRAEFLALARG